MGIKITGMDGLQNFLSTSPTEIANGPIRKALRAGGTILKTAYEEHAPMLEQPESPTSDALPPGALKSDIVLKVTVAAGSGIATIGPSSLTEHVARWVEYGHHMVKGGYLRFTANGPNAKMKRGKGKWLKEHDVPAHPWVRPAVEATIDQARKAMYETFGREMIKVANRKLRSSGGGRAA